MMEKMEGDKKLGITVQDKAYFHSGIHINLVSTDVKEILAKVIHTILKRLAYTSKMVVGGILKKFFNLKFTLLFTNQ